MLQRLRIPAALIVAVLAVPAFGQDVAVTLSIGQPGYYGRIDVGDYPRPQLIYSRPVVIEAPPINVAPAPVYLRVPPGHAKNWRKHCRKYDACGQPVYFVSDRWYQNVYAPEYRRNHGKGSGQDHGGGNGHKPKKHGND